MLLSSSKVLYIHAVVEEAPATTDQMAFVVLQRTANVEYVVRIGQQAMLQRAHCGLIGLAEG